MFYSISLVRLYCIRRHSRKSVLDLEVHNCIKPWPRRMVFLFLSSAMIFFFLLLSYSGVFIIAGCEHEEGDWSTGMKIPSVKAEIMLWRKRKRHRPDPHWEINVCRASDCKYSHSLQSWTLLRQTFRPGQLRQVHPMTVYASGRCWGSGRAFAPVSALSTQQMILQEPPWCKHCTLLARLVHEVWGNTGKILVLCRQLYLYHPNKHELQWCL